MKQGKGEEYDHEEKARVSEAEDGGWRRGSVDDLGHGGHAKVVGHVEVHGPPLLLPPSVPP